MNSKNSKDPATQQEMEEARRLGEALDQLLAGEKPDREDDLVATARMIRSAASEEELAADRRDAAVQEAMRRVLERPLPRRSRWVASVAAIAASLALVTTALLMVRPTREQTAPTGPPTRMVSRPSNDLMGRPFVDRAGASSRLDMVFADRLAGYRQVTLLAGEWP